MYEESTLSSIVAAGYTLKLNWKIQEATGTVHFTKVKPNLYAVWSRQFIKTTKKTTKTKGRETIGPIY